MRITDWERPISHIDRRPMKRVLQLAVLIMGTLLAAQPLLACTSCMQQADGCASNCCSGAGGMAPMPGMQMSAACQAAMQTLPQQSGCGQPTSSVAEFPRFLATLALPTQSKIRGLALLVGSVPIPLQLDSSLGLQNSFHCSLVAPTPKPLFQILRI